jgi:chromosome condensin MukBEF complex kleisin-like MukF subunit
MVLKVGHAVGFKFKPWQAVKITKGIAVGSQVLSILGVGLEVFMQIKEDRDEDKAALELKNNRQIIRGQFYNAADELEEYGRAYVRENVIEPLDYSIRDINESIMSIREGRTYKDVLCDKILSLHKECQELINEIHKKAV